MTAEHVKWSTHLVGAAQLLLEFDFASLTGEAQRLKDVQDSQEKKPHDGFSQPGPLPTGDAIMLDEALISQIFGEKITYKGLGRILEHEDGSQEKKPPFLGKLDLKTFETLQDLQWFYMRQDAFQSMVSGNPLM